MNNNIIRFLRQKEYKFVQELDRGGFGKTVLLEDTVINERFVCKKYAPIVENNQELFFENFTREIKLLHLLSFKNIVRVFNYYLYPEKLTGHILMEYIDGLNIEQFIQQNPEKFNDVFEQTILGFQHLEQLQILHRDIRPPQHLLKHTIGMN